MLRDLKVPRKESSRVSSIDDRVACNIVDILFNHVNNCLQRDRSRVKLNALTKGMISGVLGRTREGTKEYLVGMYSEDLEILLDDMEKELARRSKRRQ
jgi:hypothetical protein